MSTLDRTVQQGATGGTGRQPADRGETLAELATRLRSVTRRVSRRLRREAEPGITESQLSALGAIKRHGPLTLGELAAHEQVQPPTMTKIVAYLEDGGLVDRLADPEDRRVVRVRATAAGRRVLQRTRARKDAYLEQRLAGLDADELDVLGRAVRVLEGMLGGDE